jgi:hypothetical protein
MRAAGPFALLAVAVFLMGAGSGCVGTKGPGKATGGQLGGAGVEQSQQAAPPAQADDSTGAISGRVVNENAAPIGDAHVYLTGTSNSSLTDRLGRFGFSFVKPGAYTLRVDAEGYRALEDSVKVTAHEVTIVNATLVVLVDRGSGFREHLHDFWGDSSEKTLFDATVNYHAGTNGLWFCVGGTSSSMACPPTASFELPDGVIVYPGTATIDVSVSWASQQYLSDVGFRYIAANETRALRAPIILKSGQTQSFPVDFGMADHGHQTVSLWSFHLVTDSKVAGQRFGAAPVSERDVGPFAVKMLAHKGVVPPEAAHQTFWTNASRVTLVDSLRKDVAALPIPQPRAATVHNCAPSSSETGSGTCISLPSGVIVPPGTTRLEVTYWVDYGTAGVESVASAKSLAFRTAAINPAHATLGDLRVEAGKKSGGKTVYDVKLEPKEADAFYQKKSLWMFSLANEGKERDPNFINECGSTGCGGTKYYVTLVAINENFLPAVAAS